MSGPFGLVGMCVVLLFVGRLLSGSLSSVLNEVIALVPSKLLCPTQSRAFYKVGHKYLSGSSRQTLNVFALRGACVKN